MSNLTVSVGEGISVKYSFTASISYVILTSLFPGNWSSYLKLEFSETEYINLSLRTSRDWPSLIETSTLSSLLTPGVTGWAALFSIR